MGRRGLSQAVKSDLQRKKQKMLQLNTWIKFIRFIQKNRSCKSGAIDIHKAIGKLPKP